eukprot:TRINITY_DN3775_c0_g1_i1.p1 TRINITY_DN3775_c0_g1~~TRINITY_DN3775_c0_g1_i1.p1  ORF type:complete len:837 (-),score=107.16 TRINITY_DN3775_c0_g1_i1:317-2827(-)
MWVGSEDIALVLWQQYAGSSSGIPRSAAFQQMVEYCPHKEASLDVSVLFQQLDLDGSGLLEREEFLTWVFHTPPEKERWFREALEARIAITMKVATKILATTCNVDDADACESMADGLPDMLLHDTHGRNIVRTAKSAGVCTMASLALASGVEMQTRLRVVSAVVESGDPWAFAALLAIAGFDGDVNTVSENDLVVLQAEAFGALPSITNKQQTLQVQAVIDAGALCLSSPSVNAHVRGAATACLGRMLRFQKVKELDICLDCELAADNMETVLTGCLKHVDPRVRRTAAESVSVMLSKGGEMVGTQVLKCLSAPQGALASWRYGDRIAGVLALKYLLDGVPQVDDAWEMLAHFLTDLNLDVRRTAHLSLQQLAPRNSHKILQHLSKLFASELVDEDVRASIVDCAAAVASNTRSDSTDAKDLASKLALDALQDLEPSVRHHALRVLLHVGPCNPAVKEVVAQLHKGEKMLCMDACRALVSAAPPRGDSAVIAAMSRALLSFQGEEIEVVEIVHLLASVAEIGGDCVAAETFLSLLEMRADSLAICVASLKGLESVAPVGHAPARTAAMSCLSQADSEVLAAAVATLKSVCNVGDEEVVVALTEVLVQESSVANTVLQKEILSTLAEICPPGDRTVIEALGRKLSGSIWPVKRAVLQTISALTSASCTYSEAFDAVELCITDANADIRQCAVETLVSISLPGDQRVIRLLEAMRAEETEIQVVMAIEEGIETLAGDAFVADNVMPWNVAAIALPGAQGDGTADSLCSFQVLDSHSLAGFSHFDKESTTSFELVDAQSCAASEQFAVVSVDVGSFISCPAHALESSESCAASVLSVA